MLVAHLIERGGKLASQLAVLQVLLGRWSRIRKRQFAFLVILALHERLRNDPNKILAVPYRIGVAWNWPGLLAAYTLIKQRLL